MMLTLSLVLPPCPASQPCRPLLALCLSCLACVALCQVERKVYGGLEHTTSQQMLGDTTQWIRSIIPGPQA